MLFGGHNLTIIILMRQFAFGDGNKEQGRVRIRPRSQDVIIVKCQNLEIKRFLPRIKPSVIGTYASLKCPSRH